MNKPLDLILTLYGLNAAHSVGAHLSRFFAGAPTDQSIWLLMSGIVAGVVGLVGLIHERRL